MPEAPLKSPNVRRKLMATVTSWLCTVCMISLHRCTACSVSECRRQGVLHGYQLRQFVMGGSVSGTDQRAAVEHLKNLALWSCCPDRQFASLWLLLSARDKGSDGAPDEHGPEHRGVLELEAGELDRHDLEVCQIEPPRQRARCPARPGCQVAAEAYPRLDVAQRHQADLRGRGSSFTMTSV